MSGKAPPTCHIIAGPNGAGKTTFALRYLPEVTGCRNFINADLIEAGGHDIPAEAIARRYRRTVANFIDIFIPLCDEVMCYDNSSLTPHPVFSEFEGQRKILDKVRYQTIQESSRD